MVNNQRQALIDELRTLLIENLELEVPNALQESDRLYEDLQIDSIMVLQLFVYIEEVFQVTIPENEVDPETFLTVGSLIDYIHSLQHSAV